MVTLAGRRFKSSDLREESNGLRNHGKHPLLTAQKSIPLLTAFESTFGAHGLSAALTYCAPPHPGVSPGHKHLGPKRDHSPQPEWRLSLEASLLCFKHQGLLKQQREVIPEYH